jgi:glycosyltransferase involved in cell wall biosynthesis
MQTPGKGVLSDFYIQKGFVVHTKRFSGPRRKFPGFYLISSFFYCLWLKKNKFDIILCNTFGATFRVSLATKMAGLNFVIYTREYFSKEKKINFRQIKMADGIFAVSMDVKSYFDSIHNNICVCHDTINIPEILARIENHHVSLVDKSYFNVGYVGRITGYKQADIFLKAAAIVVKKIPTAYFHIVGKSIEAELDYEESLKLLSIKLGISQNVKFWGHRSDSIELLKDMDLFCLTSDREPYPRTIIESMLARTPVIASNTGGCTEIINNSEAGLFFDVNDINGPKYLADRIFQLMNDKELYTYIKENAYKSIIERFSNNNQVKHFFDSLVEIHRLKK